MEYPTTKVDNTYKIGDPPDNVPHVAFQNDSPSTHAPEKVFPSSQECVHLNLSPQWC
jgi:hypothetical protein